MKVIDDTLSHVRIGDETTFRNLTVYPLLDGGSGAPDYLTLDEALAQKCARITEVSEGGSVPDLKFVNQSDRRVLLVDGEELVGAKQNRVLNLTILAPAHKTITIPVSCVEAGRWSSVSAEFASAGHTQYAGGRAAKMAQVNEAMFTRQERRSDQSEVWANIAAKAERMKAPSPTSAMEAIYEHHEDDVEAFAGVFQAQEGQVGALFALNGEIVGFDLFDYAATFRKLLPKLVRSYALDALETPDGKPASPSREAAERFLAAVAQAEAQTFAAIGEGEDARLTGDRLAGGALIADERLIHLSAFRLVAEETETAEPAYSAMSRPSARRQNWLGRMLNRE